MKLLTTEQVFLGLIRTHIGIGTRVIGNNFNVYIDSNYLPYLLFYQGTTTTLPHIIAEGKNFTAACTICPV